MILTLETKVEDSINFLLDMFLSSLVQQQVCQCVPHTLMAQITCAAELS